MKDGLSSSEVESLTPPEGRAARALEWLDRSPIVKLTAIVGTVVLALTGGVLGLLGYRASRTDITEQMRRAGLIGAPETQVSFEKDGTCRLLNRHRRPLTNAAVVFKTYIVDENACQWAQARVQVPHAEQTFKDSVPPLQFLEASYPFEGECAPLMKEGCPPGHKCRAVVECEATFDRVEDVTPFENLSAIVTDAGCGNAVPLSALFATVVVPNQSDQIVFDQKADERLMECFRKGRATQEWMIKEAPDNVRRQRNGVRKVLGLDPR